MQQLGMVGTSFRRGGQQAIEAFTFASDERAKRAHAMHLACDMAESVYIATCNRVEVVFVGHKGVPVDAYRRRLYRFFAGEDDVDATTAARSLHAYEGEGAAEHLFCVAAGLDSANPGEAQILGQVKDAFRSALDLGTAAGRLGLVFQEAFEAAKRVRFETTVGEGAVSMVSLSLGLVESRLQRGQGRLCVIGAGDMATQCGVLWGGRDDVSLCFVNRTRAPAEHLAARFGGSAAELSAFLAAPGAVDVLVTSTAAPEPFLDDAFFAAVEGDAPLIVDLAVPRDTNVEAAARHGADLWDIDRLTTLALANRQRRQDALAQAREIIDEALRAFQRRVIEQEVGAVVRRFRRTYEGMAQRALADLYAQGLVSAGAEDKRRIERWMRLWVRRLAHGPTVGIKRLAHAHGIEAVDTFVAPLANVGDATKGRM